MSKLEPKDVFYEPTATYCDAISASRIGPAFPPLENTDVVERVGAMELRNTPPL